jgi:hypothetical protein
VNGKPGTDPAGGKRRRINAPELNEQKSSAPHCLEGQSLAWTRKDMEMRRQ